MRSWPCILVLSLALILGCSSDAQKKPGPPPSIYLPRTSITNVLANLTRAYTEKNYEEYQKLVDTSYEYIFAPQDIGGPSNIPASWGRADELASANNLFNKEPNKDGYWAETISLSYTAGPDTTTNLNPNWRKVVLKDVLLRVNSRHKTTSDPLTYEVSGDEADLYLVQTQETAPGTDLHIWRIVRWEDKPILGATKTSSTTWGAIRGLFL